MSDESEKIQEISIADLSNDHSFNLSGDFICDVETGICGPAEEIKDDETKEQKNENNDMV